MYSGYIYFQQAIISLLILATINISLDLSYYSFRTSSYETEFSSEIDVNSVAELLLEVGLDLKDHDVNEGEEEQPVKPQKPSLKIIPSNPLINLVFPKRCVEIFFVFISQVHFSSFFNQDSPPPRV